MAEANKTNQVSEEAFKAAIFEDGGNLVVDLGGIAEAKFEAIPKGIYDGEIDTVEFGMSNNSGAPMLTLQIAITNSEQYNGRKLYTYLSFSQKALPFTKATIQRMAPELLSGKFSPQAVADQGMLLGKPVRIRVAVEDYQGEPRSKISQVLAPSTGDAANATGGSTKGFF
jgi:hypothetical protein